MEGIKKTVSEIKSIFGFGINIGKGRVFYPLTKIKVYASSGDSISYCLFTILKKESK